MHEVEGEFTAAIRSITAATEDLRQLGQTAEQIMMEREYKIEQQRLSKMMHPADNDRK